MLMYSPRRWWAVALALAAAALLQTAPSALAAAPANDDPSGAYWLNGPDAVVANGEGVNEPNTEAGEYANEPYTPWGEGFCDPSGRQQDMLRTLWYKVRGTGGVMMAEADGYDDDTDEALDTVLVVYSGTSAPTHAASGLC